jgi:hypothetical protein
MANDTTSKWASKGAITGAMLVIIVIMYINLKKPNVPLPGLPKGATRLPLVITALLGAGGIMMS